MNFLKPLREEVIDFIFVLKQHWQIAYQWPARIPRDVSASGMKDSAVIVLGG
jgi:hypothetical protein